METRRNNSTGDIVVLAKDFTVHVSEDAVKVLIGDAVAHEWKPSPKDADSPSPRSHPNERKRGTR